MGPIELLVQGTLQAPADPAYFRGSSGWINFQYINQFTLSGAGTFDGQGQIAWKQNDCGGKHQLQNTCYCKIFIVKYLHFHHIVRR